MRAALKHARQAFEKKPAFDPAKSERVFTLIATDFIQMLLATKLMSTLASIAPGVSVTFKVPTGAVPAAALAAGDADLAFAHYAEAPAGIYRQKLFSDRLASTVRAGHPNVGDKLPLKDFLALKHVIVSFSGGRSGSLDAELARRSLKREIAIVVPYLYLALRVVSETDYVATMPERLIELYRDDLALQCFPAPVQGNVYDMYQIWHERTHLDPAGIWLRKLIKEMFA